MNTFLKTASKVTMIILVAFIILGYVVVQYGFVGAEFAGLVKVKLSKPDFHYSPWIYVLYAHIVTGCIALFIGLVQLLRKQQKERSQLHRRLGKIYVLSILLSGIFNLYLTIFASGGWVSQVGFLSLDALWIYATLTAVNRIRNKQVEAHQQWMIRSYALTFAGVTLRIWLPLLMIPFEFETAYPMVAWLAWVPNWLIAEWVIRRRAIKVKRQTIASTSIVK
ncbi:DUF2306 domain-containing protein [Paenibacillus frigoriresistens]|uniref:DUF2306 domain-containing protein n=1 Tax=Paenibacillus alginolyticus TaxID=59839 RepID=UPI001567B36D|nr:DUF2306 domain-containing protein [Paenibacillus frigoriresistens]NRF94228.1 DUF2306 domain-containing protein [Paenibacillus frigoriresistens]